MPDFHIPNDPEWQWAYDAILYTTGGEFPEADPTALRAMGDELYAFTNNLLNGTAATSNLGNGLSAYLDGPAADAFNQFRGGIANDVPIAGNISWALGNAAYEFALDSESTQYNIVIAAFTQVVEIAFAIASGFGAAAVPALIKVGQEIVKTLIDFLRMRLQNQLLRLVWEGIEEGLEELWQGAAAQLTQMAEGKRKGFDYQDLALAFAGGFFIGMGVSGMHAIGGKLYPKINKNTYTRETLSALAETLFEGLFSMMVGGGFNPFATMTSSIIGGLAHQYAHDFGKQFGADPQNLPDRPSPDPKTGSDKAKTPPTSVEGPPPPAYHDIGDSPPSYDQAAGGPPPYSETPGDPPPYNEATGPSNAATGAPPSVGSSPVPGSPVTNGSHTAQPSDAERDGALTPATASAFANRPDPNTVNAPAPNRSVAPAPGTAPASAGALRPGIAGVNQLGPASGQVPAQTTGSAGSVAAHPAATPAAPPPATSPAEDVAPVAAPAGADATLPANAGGLPGFESTSPAASAPTDPTAPPPVIVETTAPASTQAADAAASPAADPAGQAPTVATPVTAVPAVEVPRTGDPDAESPMVQAPTDQPSAFQPPTTQSPGQQASDGSIPGAQENNTPLSSASPPPQIANPVASAPATIEQGSTVPGPAVKQALASESGATSQVLDGQQTLVTSNPHHTYMTTTTTQPSLTSGTMQSPLSSDSPLRNDSTRDTTTRTDSAGDSNPRSQADGPRSASGQNDRVVTSAPTAEVAPAAGPEDADILIDLPSGSSTDSGAENGPRTTATPIRPTADGMKPPPVTPQSGPAIPAPRGAPNAVLRTEPAAASTSNLEATTPISPFAPVPANESNQGQSTTESYDGLALGGTGNQAAPGSAPVLLADVVPRDQWWRLYLDPKHHDAAQDAYPNDPGSYYDNDQSPGFQKGMIEAYEQFLNNPDINSNNLDADTYKQIHEKVTRYLNKQFDWTGAPTPKGISSPTSFPVRSPDISPDILTEDIGGRPLVQDFNLALRQTDGPKPVTFTSTIMDRRGISAIRRPRSITTNYSRNDAPTLVNTIFDQYRHERQNATTPDATLAAIARAIRKLHITHPFQDGNRRLNVHVILPKLLLDNGFQPVIASDMDQLFQGGRSIDDIVTVLRDAQPATAGIRLGTEPNLEANFVPAAQITTVVDVPAITSVAAQAHTTALAALSNGPRHDSSSVVPLATVVRGADGVLRASGKPLVIRPLTGDRPGIALLDDGDWNRVSTRTLLPPDTYAAAQGLKGDPAAAVIVHGVGDVVHAPVRNPDGSTTTVALGPDGLAQVIGRPGAPIVLASCETGALTGGFAHQLAHAHDGDVLAPKTVINVGSMGVEGGLRTTGNESWQLYTPHSLDDEGWDAVNDVATGTPPLFGINATSGSTSGPGAGIETGSTTGQSNRSDDGIATVRRSTQPTNDGIRLGPEDADILIDLPSGSSTDSGAENGPRTTATPIRPTADGMKPPPVTPQSGPAIPAPRGAPNAVLRTEPAAASTSNLEATTPISPFAPVPANESNQGQSTTESYDGLALGGTGNQAAPGSAPVLLADVVPRDQWWRLYLDPKHHDAAQDAYPNDPGSYYDNDQSPGFQKGMIEAYEQFLNNPDINSNNLDADTYKQIHEKVTRYLNKQFDWTGAPTPKGISSPTSFPVRSPDISPDILTEDIGGRPLVQDFNLALRQTDGPKPVTFTSTIMDRRGISAIRRPRSITTNYSRNDAPTLVNTIFDQYRHERQNATTPDATLAAIARAIRKLHITHPFQDGNRRLNVHVILPKLLLDNGFQPVIASDMDQLFQGGRSIDDIVTVLRDAQPATAGIRLGTEPNLEANFVPAAQITTVVDVPAITSVAAQAHTTALAALSNGPRHDSSSVVPLATVVRGADGVLRASGKPLVIRPLTGDRPGIALLDDGDWNRVSTRTLLPPDTYAAAQGLKGDPAAAVIVHGVGDVVHAPVRNPDGSTTTVALGPDGLAQVIGRPGAPIVLASCETGALTGGFAHQLAHAHDGDVLAPKTVINVGSMGVEGGLRTTGNESWQLYTPHSLDDEGWDAVNDVATGTPPLFGINATSGSTSGPGAGIETGSTTGQSNRSDDGIATVRRSTQPTNDGIRLGPKPAPTSNIARAAQPPSLSTIPEETEQDLDPPNPSAPSAVSREREKRRVPQPDSTASGDEVGYTGVDDPPGQVADGGSATDNADADQTTGQINPDGTPQKHGAPSEDTASQPPPTPPTATTQAFPPVNSTPRADVRFEFKVDADADSELKVDSKPEPKAEANLHTGSRAKADARAKGDAEAESESKPESKAEADFKAEAEAEQKSDSGDSNSSTVLSPEKLRSALPDYLLRSEALGLATQFRAVALDDDTNLINELELLAPGISQSVLEELSRDIRDDFDRFLGEGYSYPVRIGREAAELTVTARFDWGGLKPDKMAKKGPKKESKTEGSHSRSVELDHYPHADPKFFFVSIPSALVTGRVSIPTASRSTISGTSTTSFIATALVEVGDQVEVAVPAAIYASLRGSAGQPIDARPPEKHAFPHGPGKVTARGIVPLRVPTKLAVPEPGPDPLPARVPTALPKRFGVESVVVHSDPDRGTHFEQVAKILQEEGMGDIVRVGAPGRSVLKQFLFRGKLPVADATTVGADRAEEGWATSQSLLRTPGKRDLWHRVFPGRDSALQARLVARRVQYLGTVDGVKYEDGFKLANENTDSKVVDRPWAATLTAGSGGMAPPVMYVVGPMVRVSSTSPSEQNVVAKRVGRHKVKVKGPAVRYLTVYDLEVRLIGRPAQRLGGAIATLQWTTKDRVRGTSLDTEPAEWQGRTGDRRTHFAPASIEQGRSFGGANVGDLDGVDRLRKFVIDALRDALGALGRLKLFGNIGDKSLSMTQRLIPALDKRAFVRQFHDPELAKGLTGTVQAILSRREDIEIQISDHHLRFLLDRIVETGLEIPLTMNGTLHDYTTVVTIKGKLSSLSDGEILSQKVQATENRAAKIEAIASKGKSWASSVGVTGRLRAVLGPAFPIGIVGPRVGYTVSRGHNVGVKRRHESEIARAPDLEENGELAKEPRREFLATLKVATSFVSSVKPNQSRRLLTPGRPGSHVPTVVSGALPPKEDQLELRLLVPEHRVTLSPPPSAPAPEPVDREWMTNPPALSEVSGGYPYKLDGSLVETFLGAAHLIEGVKETLTRATNDPIWGFAGGSISTRISESLAPDQLTGGNELFSKPVWLSPLVHGRRRADTHAQVTIRLIPCNPLVQEPTEFHAVKDILAGGSSSGAKQASSWGGSLSIRPVGVLRGPAGDPNEDRVTPSGVFVMSGTFLQFTRGQKYEHKISGMSKLEVGGRPEHRVLVELDVDVEVIAEVRRRGNLDVLKLLPDIPTQRAGQRFTLHKALKMWMSDRQARELEDDDRAYSGQLVEVERKTRYLSDNAVQADPHERDRRGNTTDRAQPSVPANRTITYPAIIGIPGKPSFGIGGADRTLDLSNQIGAVRRAITAAIGGTHGTQVAQALLPESSLDAPHDNVRMLQTFLSHVDSHIASALNGGRSLLLRLEGRFRGHTYQVTVTASMASEPEFKGIMHVDKLTVSDKTTITRTGVATHNHVKASVSLMLRGRGMHVEGQSAEAQQHSDPVGVLGGAGTNMTANWGAREKEYTDAGTLRYFQSLVVEGPVATFGTDIALSITVTGRKLPNAGVLLREVRPLTLRMSPYSSRINGPVGVAGEYELLPISALSDSARSEWRNIAGVKSLPEPSQYAVEHVLLDVVKLHDAAELALTNSGVTVDATTQVMLRAAINTTNLKAGLPAMLAGRFTIPLPHQTKRELFLDARVVGRPKFAGANTDVAIKNSLKGERSRKVTHKSGSTYLVETQGILAVAEGGRGGVSMERRHYMTADSQRYGASVTPEKYKTTAKPSSIPDDDDPLVWGLSYSLEFSLVARPARVHRYPRNRLQPSARRTHQHRLNPPTSRKHAGVKLRIDDAVILRMNDAPARERTDITLPPELKKTAKTLAESGGKWTEAVNRRDGLRARQAPDVDLLKTAEQEAIDAESRWWDAYQAHERQLDTLRSAAPHTDSMHTTEDTTGTEETQPTVATQETTDLTNAEPSAPKRDVQTSTDASSGPPPTEGAQLSPAEGGTPAIEPGASAPAPAVTDVADDTVVSAAADGGPDGSETAADSVAATPSVVGPSLLPTPGDGRCQLYAVIGSDPGLVGKRLAWADLDTPALHAWLADPELVRTQLTEQSSPERRDARELVPQSTELGQAAERLRQLVERHLITLGPANVPTVALQAYRGNRNQTLHATVDSLDQATVVNRLHAAGITSLRDPSLLPVAHLRDLYVHHRTAGLTANGTDHASARTIAEQEVPLKPAADGTPARDLADGSLSAQQMFDFLSTHHDIPLRDLPEQVQRDQLTVHLLDPARPADPVEFAELTKAVQHWEQHWHRDVGEAYIGLLASALGSRIRIHTPDHVQTVGPDDAPLITIHRHHDHYQATITHPPAGSPVYADNHGRQFYWSPETSQWQYCDDKWYGYRASDPHGKRKDPR